MDTPTTYVYQKERTEFGKQCMFTDKNEILFTQIPQRQHFADYILRNPVSQGTQCSKQMAISDAITERAEYEHHGINHNEGGWPKDILMSDPEQTVRYKRKIEKSESYITQVMGLTKPMEHLIYQNNAVNIYENYFDDLDAAPLVEKCSSRTVNVYRDPIINKRPVTHLSWSPDCGTKLAVSHCNMDFQHNEKDLATQSYIWEIENPNLPLLQLVPQCPIICLEYNQKDPHSLVSGLMSGQVAIWDTRYGSQPTQLSEREVCHRDPVNSVLWINSKSGTDFFSGSSDGQVIWWDTRKIQEPIEKLFMDPIKTDDQVLSRSYGVSILEYETTIPTRFMCGTEQGMIFSCNRKGKSPIEKIQIRMMCHLGSIYAITRNPAFVKNFLTVGDWTARIWSEECRESSIIWTKNHTSMLTDGAWSYTKVSMFFISRMDGRLDCWDLLQQQNEPILSIKVCDEPIKSIRTHENGKLIAAGSLKGATYLIEFSENMSFSAKNDKPLLTAMLERETRREKILESKLRELKLRVRTAHKHNDDDDESKAMKSSESVIICNQTEKEFMEAVDIERKLRNPNLNKKKKKKKKKKNIAEDGENMPTEGDDNGDEEEEEDEDDDDDDDDEEDDGDDTDGKSEMLDEEY